MLKPKLLRDVVVVVVAKIVLVIAAGVFVFGPAERPRINSVSMADRLIGQTNSPFLSRSHTP